MEIVVSGIRSTGNLHLGNYFGAVKNFLTLQEQDIQSFFFIADYHSLTTHPTPGNLQDSVKQVLVEYLACGLDPEKVTLYIQSQLPETAELYLLLNMNAYLGELERCTSFKDKVRTQPENVNAGLLTYPVLMAADILIHKGNKVPVGKDQEQHLEMARNFSNRFNRMYQTEVFPEPYAFNFGNDLVKIPGLDGKGKMGKSEGENNAVYLSDSPEIIRKKVMKAVTDSGPTEPNQVKPEAIQNLFSILKHVGSAEVYKHFDEAYNSMTIRYGDFKKALAEEIITFNQPIYEKVQSIQGDEAYLKKITKLGADKARESAQKTLSEVKKCIGFNIY
jgi:tryptophanyl-tRNA synthetase